MKEPVSLAQALIEVFDRWGPGLETESTLAARWAEIAGSEWADRSRPVGCREGILTVVATDGSAASYLQMRVDDLLQRLHRDLRPGAVERVVVRVGRRRR